MGSLSKPGSCQTRQTPLAACAPPRAPALPAGSQGQAPQALHFLPRAAGCAERLTRSPRPNPSALGTHLEHTQQKDHPTEQERGAGRGGRRGPRRRAGRAGPGEHRGREGAVGGVGGRPRPGAGAFRLHRQGGLFRRARGWLRPRPQGKRAETQNCPLPAARRGGGGRGAAVAGFKGLKRNLDSSPPRYVTRWKGGRLSPFPPPPFVLPPYSHPQTSHRRGLGSRRPDDTQIRRSRERGQGATRGVSAPSPGSRAGSPPPEPGEHRAAGGAPGPRHSVARPKAGADGQSRDPGGEGQEGPGDPSRPGGASGRGAPRRGPGAGAPGTPGAGPRGQAPHSPSCRRRRPRPRPVRSRPPSTCSRRCPAPTGRRSRAASASAAASSRLGRRPRPLLASLPGAAAGAGRGGAQEGEGRGGSSPGAAGGEGGARPAPELRPGRERRAAPEQEAAAAEAAGGSGSKGRPIGGGCGGPAGAEAGIAASRRRRLGCPPGSASAGRRPAAAVSDRWSPGPRAGRAHVRTHAGAHTGDRGSPLPHAARAKALPPRSSAFGTTPDPWQAPSYWPTDLSFLVQTPSSGPDSAAAHCSFLTNLAAKTPLIPRCLFY